MDTFLTLNILISFGGTHGHKFLGHSLISYNFNNSGKIESKDEPGTI